MARRKRQPSSGKWDHAVSPLQRARHDYRWHQDEACLEIRQACPGHTGKACRLEASKLSEFENHRRTPSLVHVQAMCETYQRSAEDLGLITWRRKPGAGKHKFTAEGKPSNVHNRTYGVYADSDLESLVYTLRGDDLTRFASPAGGTEGSTDVQRDTFLKGMGAVAGAAATDPFIKLTEIDRAALNTTTVSATAVEELEQAVYLHARGYYEMHLPGRLESLVSDWAAAGRLLHESQTPSQRVRLSESYARLSGILGHYNYDNDNNARAVALYNSGKDAAREAGDNDLLAWLYDRHSEVFNYGGNQRERVTLAERGLEAAGRAETLTTARLHGMAASAYAAVGDRRWSLAHHEESERILSKGIAGCWPSDRRMPRGYSFTPDALVYYMARAHLELGEYAKAAELYRETISQKEQSGMSASSVPSMTMGLVHQATAMVHTGEMEEAARMATAAIQDFGGVGMPLVLHQALAFEAALATVDTSGTYARSFSEFLREQTRPPLAT